MNSTEAVESQQTTTNETSVEAADNYNENVNNDKTKIEMVDSNDENNVIESETKANPTPPTGAAIIAIKTTSETLNSTTNPMLETSFSLKRMASKAMIYNIPDDVEHTKLKDGFQCGYACMTYI